MSGQMAQVIPGMRRRRKGTNDVFDMERTLADITVVIYEVPHHSGARMQRLLAKTNTECQLNLRESLF